MRRAPSSVAPFDWLPSPTRLVKPIGPLSLVWCFVIGPAASAFYFVFAALGPYADTDPYPSVASAVIDNFMICVFGSVMLAVPAVLVIAGIGFILRHQLLRWKGGLVAVRLSAMMLVPLFVCPLFAVWWTAAVLHALAPPSVSITWSPKPAWIQSQFLAFIGSPVVLLIIGALTVSYGVVIWLRVPDLLRRAQPSNCGACGYSLSGISSEKCPECGAPRETATSVR